MNLYFIGIIPNEELKLKVKSLKEEMRDRFGAKHALKSPAHITLQPPFKRPEEDEAEIIKRLKEFSSGRESFPLQLSGFGSFAPRVIFINITNPEKCEALYSDLKKDLVESLDFMADEVRSAFHPHMTIATRDLTKEAFLLAWPEFKSRHFNAKFDVKSVFLLKHNGKFWDIYREFEFGT